MNLYKENIMTLFEKETLEDKITYFDRLKMMFKGFKCPKDSKEYKCAKIECQRLAAPFFAIFIPVALICLLLLCVSDRKVKEIEFITDIVDTEETKVDLEEIPIEQPEIEQQITDVIVENNFFTPDIAMDTPVPVQVEGPVSAQPQSLDAVIQIKSPIILRGIYGDTRNAGMRGAQLAKFGGNKVTETSVIRSLRWLKAIQNPDGSWPNNKVAMTGLAILTFLAHGEKPGESAEFGTCVTKALEFIMSQQESNGLYTRSGNGYAHAIATYAMCEAYGMTMNPNVKESADKALQVIINGQHPSGGWDYNWKQSERDDTSVMGWAAQALKAGMMANVYHDPDEIERASKLCVKGFKKNGFQDGGFGYTSPAKGGLTGVGTLCMQFHHAANDPYVKNSFKIMDEWILGWGKDENSQIRVGIPKTIPVAKLGQSNNPQYASYYYIQCFFQDGGDRWKKVNGIMQSIYPNVQIVIPKESSNYIDNEGNYQDVGYWIHDDINVDSANKTKFVMSTCLTCLQLEVYYRYLPSYERITIPDEKIILTQSDDDIIVESDL